MSAIFGILNTRGAPIEKVWLESMRDEMAHRGPDGAGIYHHGSVGLGHLLLQVTPESKHEKSPCWVEGLVVCADARLDEREVLMDQLRIPAERRLLITDPALIGLGYRKWGERCVEHFLGDFAFALWDEEARTLFCGRDYVGVKPFLYTWVDGLFCWSTEMKALLNLPVSKKNIVKAYEVEFILGIQSDPAMTIWEGIYRLRPSECLILEGQRIKKNIYWNEGKIKDIRFKKESAYAEELFQLINQAVIDRCRTDYAITSMLSGGLDSSAITCMAAQHLGQQNRQLGAISSVLPEDHTGPERDEKKYIQAVLEQEKNISIQYINDRALRYGENLVENFTKSCYPFNAFYYLDEAIFSLAEKTPNTRRLLSGYFGDMAASNWSFQPLPHLLSRGRFKALYHHLKKRQSVAKSSLWKIIRRELILPITPSFLAQAYAKSKNTWQPPFDLAALPLRLSVQEIKAFDTTIKRENQSTTSLSYKQYLMPNHLDYFKEEWDCMTGHRQLDMVFPLADKRILDFMLGIPPELLEMNGQSRGLFRAAIANVTPTVVHQRTDKGAYQPSYAKVITAGIKNLEKKLTQCSHHKLNIVLFDNSLFFKYLRAFATNDKTPNFVENDWYTEKMVMILLFNCWLDQFA